MDRVFNDLAKGLVVELIRDFLEMLVLDGA